VKASPQTARRLRRSQTDAERILWFRLRDRRFDGWKFRRQFPIDRFIVDFFCADAHLIIELDGGQHAVRAQHDKQRTRILEAMGYLVLRFWNNDVTQNIDGVLQVISDTLESHKAEPFSQTSEPPHPNPLPSGERECASRAANAATSEDVKHGGYEGKLFHLSPEGRGRASEASEGEGVRKFRKKTPAPKPSPPNSLPSGERKRS
jgi:very-short-patch-repair endonuclease